METQPSDAFLLAIQREIPLAPRPFALIGAHYGLSEDAVLGRLSELVASRRIRRLAAIFDVRRLGYRSALCAVRVPAAELAACAGRLQDLSGMTHCYERGWPSELDDALAGAPPQRGLPNLWFTMAALHDRFNATIETVRERVGRYDMVVLPAIRRFKIDVVFHPASRHLGELFPGAAASGEPTDETESLPYFNALDRAIVRRLQASLPLVSTPYDTVAAELGLPAAELLARLIAWKESGVLRRMGAIMQHRRFGFAANGMCVWNVPADDVVRAGRALAAYREVTHCYERPRVPAFPYSVFAMIHAGGYAAALDRWLQLSEACGLADGCILFSLQEFKKTSPRYFEED